MNNYEKIQLASELNIKDVIDQCGVQLPTNGDRIVCPFCGGDNKTKFRIYEKTNSFYCFCCGCGGGPIQFASAYLFGSTEREYALQTAEYLNSIFGMWTNEEELTEEQKKRIKDVKKRRNKKKEEEEKKKRIIEKEEKLYQLHKKNEAYFASVFNDESVSAETIMDRIVFDCMVMQEQEYLDTMIKEKHLY